MAECIHELPEGQCGLCKAKHGPVWAAQYPGTCVVCNNAIETGESIRHSVDGTAYQHASHV